jgi:hypothetical protein
MAVYRKPIIARQLAAVDGLDARFVGKVVEIRKRESAYKLQMLPNES